MHAVEKKCSMFGSHKIRGNDPEFSKHGKDRCRFWKATGRTNCRSIFFGDKGGERGVITPDGRGPHSNVLNTIEYNLTFLVYVKILCKKRGQGIVEGFGYTIANVFLVGFMG